MDGNETRPGTTRKSPADPLSPESERPTPEILQILETAEARTFTQAQLVLQEADAKSAAGTVMLEMWEEVLKDPSLIGKDDRVESLRFTLAVRAIFDIGRREKRDKKKHVASDFDLDTIESRFPSPDRGLEQEDFWMEVGRALAKLGPRAAEIWKLKYVAELSAEEIATRLGIEKSGAVTQAYKANLVVRAHLERHQFGTSRGKQS